MAIQQSVQRSSGTTNLADILERVLDKGIVIAGDIKLILGDVEVLTLQIRLVVCSVDKAREIGLDWWTNNPNFGPAPAPRLEPEEDKSRESSLHRIEKRLSQIEKSLQKTREASDD